MKANRKLTVAEKYYIDNNKDKLVDKDFAKEFNVPVKVIREYLNTSIKEVVSNPLNQITVMTAAESKKGDTQLKGDGVYSGGKLSGCVHKIDPKKPIQ